ncbi:hypothetical protein J3D55_002124 [Chryseobacterium ginsenosidimutans]|uniref:hypothetical protein n=1 Tax=Chryseobacterium ginsenosidimutans TaxID=687846 RepID=UPI002167D684|nr:hypothetical protein [Chryseobacterium ginsenosidimutans]MCS3869208.1 hypothetical protein [Chryseobacterium ginsenosidimutans]
MKKCLLGVFLVLLSCGNSDDLDNQTDNLNPPQAKIQTLTIQDEEISNGNATLLEKLDFKFEYNQDKLVKVWDIHNNYTENLTYNNNLLTDIIINGYVYPGLEDHVPLNVQRKLSYDNSNRLIKSENPVVANGAKSYTTFEYPSADIIIAKKYTQYVNNTVSQISLDKIHLNNGNVTKVEKGDVNNPSVLTNGINYEYDQKTNPNSLIDRNRILGLFDYSFNLFMLQDYSQLSKNNVIKRTEYVITNGGEYLYEPTNFIYDYQNNLTNKIIYQYDWPTTPSLKVSAIYGY